MIYEKLSDISYMYDTFIFDAYGVFWDGRGFYQGCLEAMEDLVQQGKTVVILSNSTSLSEDLHKKYAPNGLIPYKHYNYMISSGDLLAEQIQHKNISFSACQHPKTFYVIGEPHTKIFADSAYKQVNELSDADFVYIGVPYIYPETYRQYPQYTDQFLPVMLDEHKQPILWDTLVTAPFSEIVKKIAYLRIPALNANPDFTAQEGHPLISKTESSFVIRNGSIAEMLRNRGVEVLEYGKPHKNLYDYVFKTINNDGIKFNKERTCMIGDTIRTDIKGALISHISPILCLDTGVTSQDIALGLSVEEICCRENVDFNRIIQIHSVGGR